MAVTLTSARFVGRERELDRIARALERSGEGTPTTLFVTGSGGIGATRLLVETRRRLAGLSESIDVIDAQAHPAWRGRPFAPIETALGPILRPLPDSTLADLVGPSGDALALVLPELRPRLADLDLLPRLVPVAAPERRLARVLEAIVGLLGRLADRRPVLLLVEDLHVADAATRALVTFLARTGRQQRIAVIGTYPPDELTRSHPLQADLRAIADLPRPVEKVELQPLDGAELAELIEGIEGERPSASMLLLVSERSRGNPLVAEELLAARRELSGAPLTGSLERLVTARVALRSPECRRVLRLLSVAGEPLTRSRLASVAAAYEAADMPSATFAGAEPPGRTNAEGAVSTARRRRPPPRSVSGPRRGDGILDADLAAGLAEAVASGILVAARDDAREWRGEDVTGWRRDPSGTDGHHSRVTPPAAGSTRGVGGARSEDAFIFRHQLVARAVAADLLPATRRRFEKAMAEAGAESAAAAVPHWLGAYELVAARAAAIEAAAAAELVGSGQDALAHYEIALSLPDARPATSGERGRNAGAARRLGADLPPARAEEPGVERRAHELRARSAEAAFAAGDPSRAVAYAESAIAALDERVDWPALGLLWERLGRYRRAAGDHEGAVHAHRRAVAIVPPAVSRERAHVLAALAQVTMLEGTFSESERCATDAIEIARKLGDDGRPDLVHATCTLAIVKAWGDEPETGVRMLLEARAMAADLGQLDDLFRAHANLTTALDLLGRREEAIAVAREGIAEAERYGQETVYGNFLRGNAADSLFVLGRWEESRALSSAALAWSPAGIGFLSPLLNLATVQIEAAAGESGGRLLGQLLLELETVPDIQFSVPAYQAAASYALWQEDPADARRVVERGWDRIRDTEDWVLIARMAASVLEVYAVAAAEAQRRRSLEAVAELRAAARPVLARARAAVETAGVPTTMGSRREVETFLATAVAFQHRLEGRDDPAAWDEVAAAWDGQGAVYRAARARWREAESLLAVNPGRIGRAKAARPIREAAAVAVSLGARPLLRALAELAGRARIALPTADTVLGPLPLSRQDAAPLPLPVPSLPGGEAEERLRLRAATEAPPSALVRGFVGAGQPTRKNTFGLSPREQEVLSLIAEGRTNHEIGDRLFISHRTVGIHVGNILSKLGVSGRVEAAAVAIRLGLSDAGQPAARTGR